MCGSTWKVEIDHIQPVALSGRSSIDNLRLACFTHNQLHAERTFGRTYMEQFRREPRTGEVTIASGGGRENSGSGKGTCGAI